MNCPSCGTEADLNAKFCPKCGITLVRAKSGDPYEGQIVAQKYRIEKMIGEGGMGRVYRANQFALDKLVVLKVLRQSLLSDQKTVARFQREARAASRLNHPNSIGILDFGQADDGALFIAMEYVPGRDLHQIISKEWPLSQDRVVRIVVQVLSALSEAHGAGVIHRDLKPENIMIENRRDQPDFVKVLDFGIAKIQDSDDDGPALTRAGFVCGTPEYMSPEQARGSKLDHRSDLYAVGVILYQMVSGKLPFESDSAVGFATKHLTEEPVPPSQKRPEARILPALERLILKAIAKDPDARPQTADAFIQALLNLDSNKGAPASLSMAELRRRNSGGSRALQFPIRLEDAGKASEASNRKLQLAPRSSFSFFKILTVGLFLAGGGWGVHRLMVVPNDQEPFVAPTNAPVPGQSADADELLHPDRSGGISSEGKSIGALYARDVPEGSRDAARSESLTKEADWAFQQGYIDVALRKYQQAFEKNPRPDISLKLGEIYHQQNQTVLAKVWWQRHLKDESDSKAREYIQQVFSDL